MTTTNDFKDAVVAPTLSLYRLTEQSVPDGFTFSIASSDIVADLERMCFGGLCDIDVYDVHAALAYTWDGHTLRTYKAPSATAQQEESIFESVLDLFDVPTN